MANPLRKIVTRWLDGMSDGPEVNHGAAPVRCLHCERTNVEYAVKLHGESPDTAEPYCAADAPGSAPPGSLFARVAEPGVVLDQSEFADRARRAIVWRQL